MLGVLTGACRGDGSSGDMGGTGDGGPLDTNGATLDDGVLDSSGGAEESGFGMDDDMPLVASIPEIKSGTFGIGSYVRIPAAIVTSDPGQPPAGAGFFLQDYAATSFAGIRVGDAEEFSPNPRGETVWLIGTVARDSEGSPFLRPERIEATGLASEPDPLRTELTTVDPSSPDREPLRDMVLEVMNGSGDPMEVLEELEPMVFTLQPGVVVDLRAFDVAAPSLAPGTMLQSVTGILVADGDRSAILPRDAEDIVPAG